MVSEKVTIVNPSGLHLLNAVNLSNSVSRYKSSMSFTYENNGMQGTVNLKSILSIVAAGIRQGDECFVLNLNWGYLKIPKIGRAHV